MAQELAVAFQREALGRLTLHGKDERYELDYDPSWLAKQAFAISPHLQPGACASASIQRFLANLLPEGRWLDEISSAFQVSKANVFALVALIGAETTGALSFAYPHQQQPTPTSFRPVSNAELRERLAQRQQLSLARWDAKLRLSVAGVQDKLPLLLRPDGSMGFGEGELASTHIFKFAARPELHTVVNEFLCMRLASLVKLPVAQVSLQRLDEAVLVVQRFDRRWRDDKVERLHLIDGCQLLDLPPSYKYERPFGSAGEGAKIRTGASLPQLFAACELCRVPALAQRELLHWVLFNVLIGNNDAHAKNISFFVNQHGIDVAPFYDLLDSAIYGDSFDTELAMAIGDEFVAAQILPYQLAELCESAKLAQRQVAKTLHKLCTTLLKALGPLAQQAQAELQVDEQAFAERLLAHIECNALKFLQMAKELPQVRI